MVLAPTPLRRWISQLHPQVWGIDSYPEKTKVWNLSLKRSAVFSVPNHIEYILDSNPYHPQGSFYLTEKTIWRAKWSFDQLPPNWKTPRPSIVHQVSSLMLMSSSNPSRTLVIISVRWYKNRSLLKPPTRMHNPRPQFFKSINKL